MREDEHVSMKYYFVIVFAYIQNLIRISTFQTVQLAEEVHELS